MAGTAIRDAVGACRRGTGTASRETGASARIRGDASRSPDTAWRKTRENDVAAPALRTGFTAHFTAHRRAIRSRVNATELQYVAMIRWMSLFCNSVANSRHAARRLARHIAA
jgi:hypothetical protein